MNKKQPNIPYNLLKEFDNATKPANGFDEKLLQSFSFKFSDLKSKYLANLRKLENPDISPSEKKAIARQQEDLIKEEKQLKEKLPGKLLAITKMVADVCEKISNRIGGLDSSFSNIASNVVFTTNLLASTVTLDIELKSANGTIRQGIALNLKKLLAKPSMEVYAVVAAASYKMASTLYDKEKNDIFALDKNKDDSSNSIATSNTVDKVKNLIAKYLEGFLESVFGDKFEEYDNIAMLIAGDIIDGLKEEELDAIAMGLFDMSKLNQEGMEGVESFIYDEATPANINELSYDNLAEARISRLQQYALDPSKKVESSNYQDQANALLDSNLASKFRALANEDITKASSAVIDACQTYIDVCQKKFNVGGLSVEFIKDPNASLGGYVASEHKIKLNLARLDSVEELAQTISHEFAHAAAAAKNISQGKKAFENDISEDLEGAGLGHNTEGYQFLKKIQNYCYHINPNEREGRVNELSAMIFMKSISSGVSKFEGELKTSGATHIRYMCRTLEMAKELQTGKLKEFRSEFNSMKGRLPSRAQQFIEKRLTYLERLVKDKDLSVEFADDIENIKQTSKVTGVELTEQQKKLLQSLEKKQEMEAELPQM